MRKIKEILRLSLACGLSCRKISRSCGVGHGTVWDYLARARVASLSWERVQGLDEGELERLLFPPAAPALGVERPLPDWTHLHRELRRKGVTLALLWQEYKECLPEGLQYSRFCDLYREWKGRLSVTMRQEHRAGEKTFVDYCGATAATAPCSTAWPVSTCWCSMTGAWPPSAMASGRSCTSCSMIATSGARRSSPASSPWTHGTA